MALLQKKKKHRACFIVKDHVIRLVTAAEGELSAVNTWGERYLPPGVIDDGRITDHETFARILEECVDTWNLKRKPFVFNVPDAYVAVRQVEVPASLEPDEIVGHIYLELGERIQLPFDDPVIDYHLLEEGTETKQVLVVASPRDVINAYVEHFEDAGLKPKAADAAPLSFYRLLSSLDRLPGRGHLMLIHHDTTSVHISIFHRHIPVFIRQFQPSNEAGHWRVVHDEDGTERLELLGDETGADVQARETAEEALRIMNFYRYSFQQGEAGVEYVFVAGDHPGLAAFIAQLKQASSLPVEEMTAGAGAFTVDEELPSRFVEAAGLIIKQRLHK
ncbi:type IV pilus assembly protein PilM [Salsuginibacillus halophilus]|uniref:Type IV pilus assembly protein PilM n=1 Tax=Salsuginibacillus halophilus TaxID=517424 RepID=A0A2P8HCL5_9BACI|nr:pilus assembly protein PilM [Salsuginibacillus halophilus]PSL43976.1 type IV pilus assembly protein PilM [Salsuginibacillus halophilus]